MKVCPVEAEVIHVVRQKDLTRLKGTLGDYVKLHKTGWATVVVKLH
jgi:hypothetical protein